VPAAAGRPGCGALGQALAAKLAAVLGRFGPGPRGLASGERGVELCLGGAPHRLGGLGAGEASDVEQPDQRFDAGGRADGDRQLVYVGVWMAIAQRCQSVFDDKTRPHQHPDSVMYTLSSFQRRIAAGGREVNVDLAAGQVRWLGAQEHTGHNTGSTDTRTIFIELKEPAPSVASESGNPLGPSAN
jgi:hypothetical protein